MSYQSRKAVARSFLILLLIAILSFAIIIYAIQQFFTRADQAVDEQACRGSILTRVKSNLRVAWVVELNPFPIVCKTQQKELKGDKEQVMMQISDLSARCWWTFLNGEYGNIFDTFNLKGDEKCFICYFFYIDGNIEPISGKELMDYMGENFYLTQEDEEGNEEGISYLEYIQSWKGSGRILASEDIQFIGEKEEVYSIYFVSPDVTWLGKLIGDKEIKEMNMIYIEQIRAEGAKTKCKVLESI